MNHPVGRLAAIALLCVAAVVRSQQLAAPGASGDVQRTVDAIAAQVAEIRGLPFVRPVPMEVQAPEAFGAYVRGRVEEVVPPTLRHNYDRVVRTLGLYRGPAIGDYSAMVQSVMTSQAGAYYDPERQRFYLLMTRMPELMKGVLYSHELYHALQDQHFGLARYLQMQGGRTLDGDEVLARQSVVEGEATYVMTLWALQQTTGAIPPREMLAQVVDAQTHLSLDQMRSLLQQQPQMAQQIGEDLSEAMKAAQSIPPFILDEMVGAYLKGMAFVFSVQAQGWPAVASLYGSRPVRSTEQILHPEKWLAGENPVAIEWPDFAAVASLRSWELLDSDVLGEFRWRTVLRENGAADVAERAAAGWAGDRYAVFGRKGSAATLLLLRTAWDSAADAAEFATAYRRVLASKYSGAPTPTRIVQEGADVLIVEGGTADALDALLDVVRKARKRA